MKLSELMRSAGLICKDGFGDVEIKNIVTDSRCVEPGSLFLCIRGESADGHDHIREAIRFGAVAVVAEEVRDDCVGGAAAIIVENTRRAASLLYHAWYGAPGEKLRLIAVTGTNGKTSVSYMLRHVLQRAGRRCGVIGTLGSFSDASEDETQESQSQNHMTTPDPGTLYATLASMAEQGMEDVVMEVSSHALAQYRVDALRFDLGIFTNLSRDHLDYHGGMEDYFLAKGRLLSLCDQMVVCVEDDYGWRMASKCRKECIPCVSVSLCSDADLRGRLHWESGREGSRWTVSEAAGTQDLQLPIPGRCFAVNATLAYGAAKLLGISAQDAANALAVFGGVSGRMERVLPTEAEITVWIDYAHTPDALEKLLRSVRRFREPGGRILLVFGCGGERDRGKRKQMAQVASRLSDVITITSDNSRGEDPNQIISDILRGIDKEKEYCVIPDRSEAIRYAIDTARCGDTVVLAGKGHEKYEIDRWGKHPFDERRVVAEAYAQRQRKIKERTEDSHESEHRT